jgi:hypothetical protein
MKIMRLIYRLTAIIYVSMVSLPGAAQISPGELAKVHAHLEGMAKCTQCHTLGAKVSNEKCLDCHKEINARFAEGKGFHASSKVKGKECTICHGDHYGRNYDIVHLVKDKFDHADTGYKLEGKHAKTECGECHKKEHISDVQIRNKQETYLGLNDLCLTCHEDYHRNTLSSACRNCHNPDAFKPASNFNHSKTKFQLKGKHADITCEKCHTKSVTDGKLFQQFAGLQFKECSSCHKDPHENKFGQTCSKCHVEVSFKTVKTVREFDHSKTGYLLAGRHLQVACKSCHKTSLTAPLKHDICSDCHKDYHNNQFRKNNVLPDCSECHDVAGFSQSSFTLEKHNMSNFRIEGAHLATPCFECHKKGNDWSFRGIGEKCSDCHKDIHKDLIDPKYYPGVSCENCHQVAAWSEINFNHRLTTFSLEGKHATITCRKCHFESISGVSVNQRFSKLNSNCETCHKDIHFAQFKAEKEVVCLKCHGFDNWKPVKFDHNKTRFKLDGGHKDVACNKCHKSVTAGSNNFINYTFKEILCATCHLQ